MVRRSRVAQFPLGYMLATKSVLMVPGFVISLGLRTIYFAPVGAISERAVIVPLVVAGTLGEMTAKTAIFLAGRRLLRPPWRGTPSECASSSQRRDPGAADRAVTRVSSLMSVEPPIAPHRCKNRVSSAPIILGRLASSRKASTHGRWILSLRTRGKHGAPQRVSAAATP